MSEEHTLKSIEYQKGYGNGFKDGQIRGIELVAEMQDNSTEFVIKQHMTVKQIMGNQLYNPGLYISTDQAEADKNAAVREALDEVEGLQYGPYGSDAEYLHKLEDRIKAIRAYLPSEKNESTSKVQQTAVARFKELSKNPYTNTAPGTEYAELAAKINYFSQEEHS